MSGKRDLQVEEGGEEHISGLDRGGREEGGYQNEAEICIRPGQGGSSSLVCVSDWF